MILWEAGEGIRLVIAHPAQERGELACFRGDGHGEVLGIVELRPIPLLDEESELTQESLEGTGGGGSAHPPSLQSAAGLSATPD
jgi:hypothetical protein